MCLLFATRADFDPPTRELLSRAYERACDELEAKHHLEPGDLGALVDAMTTALVDLFHAGEREEAALTRYAVSRALAVNGSQSLDSVTGINARRSRISIRKDA
jgi:hypothetical protein